MKSNFKASILTMSTLFSALSLFAQNSPIVNGKISQGGNKPVEFATVTLLKAKDSSLVKGAVADINGKYDFEQVKPGSYLISAVAMGMNRAYTNAFTVNGTNLQVPELELTAASKTLKGVEVSAKKAFIEQKADKLVVNVESSISASGGTALEALEKSPTVTVDKDGNISMKGKSGVVVMLDGKQTNMSSADLTEMLKNMPATSVDQIELIANPSAKYDAAGSAGIINLKLKKNTNYGTNGSLSLGAAHGYFPRYNGGINLNHRNAKFNVFGSYNYSYRQQKNELFVDRIWKNDDRVFKQYNEMKQKSNYQGGKIGADYFINKNNTIGVMMDLAMGNPQFPTNGTTEMGTRKGIDSILRSNTYYDSKWKRGAYNLNYRGILDSTGKELNIDLDYARNSDKQNTDLFTNSYNVLGKPLAGDTTRSKQPSVVDIKTAKIDYVHPLQNKAKLEAGLKVSFVTTDNDVKFDSLRGANWIFDTNRSNNFIYKENINAAYMNFSKQFDKLFFQAGLRAEYTHMNSKSTSFKNQQDNIINNDSSYVNLFPSMAMTYKVNAQNSLGLSYSRRIQRPSYDDMNPFEFYIDRYTSESGNPYLRPSYTNSVELTHTFKDFLITSLGYSHTKDMVTKVLEAGVDPHSGDTIILKHKFMNVAKADRISLNVSVPMPITKWWMSFTMFTANYNMFESVLNNEKVSLNSFGFFGRTQHTFTLTKKVSAEATYFYLSPQVTEQGLWNMKSLGSLDLGVQIKVLKNKGTLKLNVLDVLNTNYFRGTFENAGQFTSVRNNNDNRQVRINFSYRFGNNNVKAARNRQTGLEAEQDRLKNN
ncbi:TonB-dependent receptor [Chitinophaga silvatica]|uniref:TonB-dependent receptor n=1 Tax=Chitinophaga silvatica TaxID=2282649 RepID=A0A3E1Y6K4_9BACT|nr:outer membrane beta-barrel family protein [Chitinophaga silvatica]RFS20559.1 TonB-dependent receptor [Chitinophaga silvatica]